MRGVFLDTESLASTGSGGTPDLTVLKQTLSDWQFFDYTSDRDTAARIADVDVIISNKVRLDEAVLEQTAAKLVCVAATGTNNVDLDAARGHGIAVCNVTAYATPSVVEHVFSLLLSLSRHLPDYQKAVKSGAWQNSRQFCLLDYPIRELSGKTLGIIGYGELGQEVARVAQAFGMQVLIAARNHDDKREGRMPLSELLPHLDVLSLHCPLTPETSNLIDHQALALMKPTALLINTARGGIVDEQALLEALIRGRLAGAAVDVLVEEPPLKGNPLLETELPNLIVTPHIAWASLESRQRLVDGIARNICGWLAGEAVNRVV